MKNSEDIYKKVIDKYYNELPDETQKDLLPEESILSNKLDLALNKMDILDTDTSTCNVNIFEIIEKAEMIKQAKKSSLEFMIFISLSSLLILTLIFIVIYFGENFFIYYELLTLIFVPISIIPLVKLSQNGGN